VAKYLPRVSSLAVAVLAGSILAPFLTLQAYMFDLLPRLGISPPSAATDLVSLLACCLAFALYPMVGLVYAVMERKREVPLLSKVIGATLSAYIVFGVQLLLGQSMAAYVGVDPSANGQASLEAVRAVLGLLVYPMLLLGGLMLLGLLAGIASAPVVFFDYAVVRRRVVPATPET